MVTPPPEPARPAGTETCARARALTAAGAVTLFGAIYAGLWLLRLSRVHDAFVPSRRRDGTVALSLAHGQALAGLGLLAAMMTPALIGSDNPSAWGLFTYVTLAWFATVAASRIRRWNTVPALANHGDAALYVSFMAHVPPYRVWAMVLSVVAMMAGLALLWAGRRRLKNRRDRWRPRRGCCRVAFPRVRQSRIAALAPTSRSGAGRPCRGCRIAGFVSRAFFAALAAAAASWCSAGSTAFPTMEMIQPRRPLHGYRSRRRMAFLWLPLCLAAW